MLLCPGSRVLRGLLGCVILAGCDSEGSYRSNPNAMPHTLELSIDSLNPVPAGRPLRVSGLATVLMSDGSRQWVDSVVVKLDGRRVAGSTPSSTLLATVPGSLIAPHNLEVVAYAEYFEPLNVAKELFVSPPPPPGIEGMERNQMIAAALLMLGGLKIVGGLVFMIVALIVKSRSTPERLSKVVWSALGTLIVLLTTVLLPSSGALSDLIFLPIPQNGFLVLLILVVSALLMFFMFKMCQRIFFDRVAWLGLQAFVVFVFSASVTALTPVLVRMGTSLGQMTSSVGFLVLSGALFGGLAFVGTSLLDAAAAHQKRPPVRTRQD